MLRRFASGLLMIMLACSTAYAQADSSPYPSRPIVVIVPTGAGSAPDILVRSLGQSLAPRLGHPFVVDNRPGAAGMIGTTTVAKAEPDGYTLLMAWDGIMAINPILYRQISYDPLKDFAPISAVGRVEFVLVAHPSFAPNSLSELIELAKSQPGKINYASAGTGEVHHIAMEAIKARTGIDLVHVPYRGGPASLNDVLGGHVPMVIIGLTPALPHLLNGKLKALAVLGSQRSRHLPDVPTVAETLPGYSIEGSWLGLFAPAKTPEGIVRKLNTEINQIIKTEEFSKFLISQGIVPMGTSSEKFAHIIRDDTARFRNIIEKAQIHLE